MKNSILCTTLPYMFYNIFLNFVKPQKSASFVKVLTKQPF